MTLRYISYKPRFIIILVQFWLSCCFVLSFMELIAALLMLPPVLTIGQTLWLCCIVIPAISLSLMVKEVDPDVMKKPQGKIQNIPSLEVSTMLQTNILN